MAATIQAMMVAASTLPDAHRITNITATSQCVSPSRTIFSAPVRPSVLGSTSNIGRSTLKGSFTGKSWSTNSGTRISTTACKAGAKADAEEWKKTVKQKDTFTESSGYIADAAVDEADQLDEYNAEKFAAVFTRRPLLLTRRLVQVASTLGWWGVVRLSDNLLGKKDQNFKKRAEQLRSALVRLGPAFVKVAQAVSSRPDVIPPEYVEELALLHDRITPFSSEIALEIIEEDMGSKVDEIFTELSPDPIAAASLGQVYRAKLKPNGQPVAVKVQRPRVRATVSLDLFIMRKLATFVEKLLNLNTDLPGVVDEWASTLFQEIDYRTEARNASKFRKMFGSIPEVVVPEMYTELTSRRVLVMEWVEGQRLSEVSDLRLVEVGVFCSLTQLLDSGYYHADPHPGNLLRTPAGKLAYLDFGMMGEMNEDLRDGLIEASVHLVNQEYDALAGDFVNLGLVPPNSEMDEFSKELTGVFQEAVAKGVRNISFGDLSEKLGLTMYKYKFRIPSYFSLVIRSLTVLEGIALTSDPNYKVLSSSYPWIAHKVLTDKSPKLRSTLQELVYKDGEFRIDRLESLLVESMRQPNLEDQEDVANKTYDKKEEATDDTRDLVKRLLTFGLTNQGDFIRELILDELAKGLDALNRVAFDTATQTLRRRSPIALPLELEPVTEDEDIKNLDNLRQLMSIFNKSAIAQSSGSDSAAGGSRNGAARSTSAGGKNGSGSSSLNSQSTTSQGLITLENPNERNVQTSRQFQSQNGAGTSNGAAAGRVPKTSRRVVQNANSNGRGLERVTDSRLVEPGPTTSTMRNSVGFQNVAAGQVASSNYNGNGRAAIGNSTELVRAREPDEPALSLNDISELMQGLSGMTQYLPLLSVVPELPFEAQQQAIRLPAELAGRVASRAVARTIRTSVPRKGRGRFSSFKSSDERKYGN